MRESFCFGDPWGRRWRLLTSFWSLYAKLKFDTLISENGMNKGIGRLGKRRVITGLSALSACNAQAGVLTGQAGKDSRRKPYFEFPKGLA